MESDRAAICQPAWRFPKTTSPWPTCGSASGLPSGSAKKSPPPSSGSDAAEIDAELRHLIGILSRQGGLAAASANPEKSSVMESLIRHISEFRVLPIRDDSRRPPHSIRSTPWRACSARRCTSASRRPRRRPRTGGMIRRFRLSRFPSSVAAAPALCGKPAAATATASSRSSWSPSAPIPSASSSAGRTNAPPSRRSSIRISSPSSITAARPTAFPAGLPWSGSKAPVSGRKLPENGQLPAKEILAIVPQLVAGLSALHQAGLVHRDIKPANILLETDTGRVVVADLGIVARPRCRSRPCASPAPYEQPLTPGYFPPELLQSSYQPTALGDQYSLAFTLWQLLTGTMPIGAFAKLHHLCKCPEGLDAVLRQALATDPAKRFPDLATFGTAFQQAAARPPRRGVIGGLLCLLALVATVYLVQPSARVSQAVPEWENPSQRGP